MVKSEWFSQCCSNTLMSPDAPKPEESLALYVQRLRNHLGLSQQELAAKAGLHAQSIGKLERGHTRGLKRKTQQGLAHALGVPESYLEAACKGITVEETEDALKICSHCWTPGHPPEPHWLYRRAKYCFLCGGSLRNRCASCDALITSLKHRFCPYCGTAYRSGGRE